MFVHCAEARSRTAAVAALYSTRHCNIPLEEAWAAAKDTLPNFAPAPYNRDAVERLSRRAANA